MCGVAGIWGHKDPETVLSMMDLQVHRGPDAQGIYIDEKEAGVLGHRRLSIMDPEGGNQPIYNENKSKVIIANGEIYNFPDLKQQLTGNHKLTTTSDSEAILHLYEEEGVDTAEFLDGMFAFAIADQKDIFLARDPIGIKPLYYREEDDQFVFASELKAFGSKNTGIHEFPPGTSFHSKQGFKPFYAVPDISPKEDSVHAYCQKLQITLENAVTKRLMSDVPWGAFLSGGLDSSLITALARKHVDKLHTFSVGIEGSRDLEAAKIASTYLDTIHHEYILTKEEIQKSIPQIIYHLESFDQDLVRSAIPCYFTSRLASDHVKVILTGEGADELFAGYTYYKSITDKNILHDELRRSVASLHNVNLQRVDRMTMAHSIEGRVPFLDLEMIKLGQMIPPELKLEPHNPDFAEKWILRKAFEDILPHDIVWRKKEQFDEGSGSVDLLQNLTEGLITEAEAAKHQRRYPEAQLRSPEECYYHQVFMDVFENSGNLFPNVGRWAERPDLVA